MRKIRPIASRIKKAGDRLESGGSWRDNRTTAERGYGARWQRERAQFLIEFPLCARCYAMGRIEAATVVDHIKPHRGNMVLFWDRSNWQSLCFNCHNQHKQREEQKEQ